MATIIHNLLIPYSDGKRLQRNPQKCLRLIAVLKLVGIYKKLGVRCNCVQV